MWKLLRFNKKIFLSFIEFFENRWKKPDIEICLHLSANKCDSVFPCQISEAPEERNWFWNILAKAVTKSQRRIDIYAGKNPLNLSAKQFALCCFGHTWLNMPPLSSGRQNYCSPSNGHRRVPRRGIWKKDKYGVEKWQNNQVTRGMLPPFLLFISSIPVRSYEAILHLYTTKNTCLVFLAVQNIVNQWITEYILSL